LQSFITQGKKQNIPVKKNNPTPHAHEVLPLCSSILPVPRKPHLWQQILWLYKMDYCFAKIINILLGLVTIRQALVFLLSS
jgi:hypothetical protein